MIPVSVINLCENAYITGKLLFCYARTGKGQIYHIGMFNTCVVCQGYAPFYVENTIVAGYKMAGLCDNCMPRNRRFVGYITEFPKSFCALADDVLGIRAITAMSVNIDLSMIDFREKFSKILPGSNAGAIMAKNEQSRPDNLKCLEIYKEMLIHLGRKNMDYPRAFAMIGYKKNINTEPEVAYNGRKVSLRGRLCYKFANDSVSSGVAMLACMRCRKKAAYIFATERAASFGAFNGIKGICPKCLDDFVILAYSVPHMPPLGIMAFINKALASSEIAE